MKNTDRKKETVGSFLNYKGIENLFGRAKRRVKIEDGGSELTAIRGYFPAESFRLRKLTGILPRKQDLR